jgi:hypothetical protein
MKERKEVQSKVKCSYGNFVRIPGAALMRKDYRED